jgi:hypothetical protein
VSNQAVDNADHQIRALLLRCPLSLSLSVSPAKKRSTNKQGLPCTSKVIAQTVTGDVVNAALLPDVYARLLLERRVQLDE